MKLLLPCVFLCTMLCLAQQPERRIAPVGRRVALVIGNEAYPWSRLTNPVADARAVAQTLRRAGFADGDTRLITDTKQAELRRGVREFVESVKPGDLAFVYYSGHGVEVKGANYLLPVDLPSDASENYVEDEAVSAQRILRDLEDRGARVRVMILDACRDNPLRRAKSFGGGLAPMEGRGSLVVFATEAGHTATDSGVFRRYLLEGLLQPGVSLDVAMQRVQRNVARATGEKQIPAIYQALLEDVVLVPGAEPVVVRPEIPSDPVAGQVKEKDGQRFVWIPPGRFTMGCSPGDTQCYGDESPAHEVQITRGFWLGQTSVTVGQWKRYRVAAGKSALSGSDSFGRKLNEDAGDDNLPAVAMTWDEAKGYCESYGGRLPTEAEWEYAARAGSTAARYGDLDAIAWYGDNSGKQKIDSLDMWTKDQANYWKRLFENGNGPHPVGRKEPNSWNLYDMLGNVLQWTADWYDEKYYSRKESVNSIGPPTGTGRALRGGSYNNNPRSVRVSDRSGLEPGGRYNLIGARCVGN